MPTFQPTPEQAAVVSAARDTEDNLLISALAGAAKTSTLVLIAEALPTTNILCLAFNKRIATEMQERLPPNCKAMTLNSLGHRVWSSQVGKRLIVNDKKLYEILKSLVDTLDPDEKELVYPRFAELLAALREGKTSGWIPDDVYPNAKRLIDDEQFFARLDEEPTILEQRLLRAAAKESLKRAFQGEIDYDDQILMPTVFRSIFPEYPLVLVDEAQDLSELNHAMLRKLVKKRLIAVGDARQSIYAFRGAHEESMSLLADTFQMRELTLSVSFRCPRAVIEHAWWHAPHMKWPEWATEGRVEHLGQWGIDDLPSAGTVILCRNNAPLFAMAIRLLRAGRYPELVGNDLGKYLVRTLQKLGDAKMKQAQVFVEVEKWRVEKLKKSRNPGKVEDQAECLLIFARQGGTLGDAIAYAQHVMAAAGPVKLMTGHKSKGLEFQHVFILDEHLLSDHPQDNNLRYVMQTRAKESLTYIASEAWIG